MQLKIFPKGDPEVVFKDYKYYKDQELRKLEGKFVSLVGWNNYFQEKGVLELRRGRMCVNNWVATSVKLRINSVHNLTDEFWSQYGSIKTKTKELGYYKALALILDYISPYIYKRELSAESKDSGFHNFLVEGVWMRFPYKIKKHT